jgi:hypothetical protein
VKSGMKTNSLRKTAYKTTITNMETVGISEVMSDKFSLQKYLYLSNTLFP